MKMSGDVSDFTMLLVRYPNNGFLSTADKTDEKLNVEEVDLKTCYGYYGSKLDDSALRDRRSLYTPDTASASSHYSNCVLAYHKDMDSRPCRKCIRDKFSTPMNASAISFLFTIQSTKAENLGTCITTRGKPLCYKFVYLQDDVCAHEISLTKKPSIWKKLLSWKAKKRPAHHLSSTERPSSQSEKLAPVVLVETPTPECLACYALIHNVLFVSTEKNYIWMERTRGPKDCGCGGVQGNQFPYRVGSLRAVPFRELNWHLYGWRKLSGGNGERICASKLPMVTRAEGPRPGAMNEIANWKGAAYIDWIKLLAFFVSLVNQHFPIKLKEYNTFSEFITNRFVLPEVLTKTLKLESANTDLPPRKRLWW